MECLEFALNLQVSVEKQEIFLRRWWRVAGARARARDVETRAERAKWQVDV